MDKRVHEITDTCFFKITNSAYIASFNNNHIANQQLYPEVEHHLYITGDHILEVISNYFPRCEIRRKTDQYNSHKGNEDVAHNNLDPHPRTSV